MPDMSELSISVKCEGIKDATQQLINFVYACERATIAISEFVKALEPLTETTKKQPE